MVLIDLRHRFGALVFSACLLSACGGGGGGDSGGTAPQALSGSATLAATFDVLVPSSITAQWNGPAGTSPTCTLQSGSVPTGMTLSSSCTLSGTPTQSGTFTPRVVLTAAGYTGSVQVDGQLVVVGPELRMPNAPSGSGLRVGTTLDRFEVVGLSYWGNLGPRAGDVLTYRLATGSLPAGLTLDPATGTLSGTLAQVETQAFSVGATLARNGGTYALAPFALTLGIEPAPIDRKAEGGYVGEQSGTPYTYRGLVLDDGSVWLVYGIQEPSNFGTAFGSQFRPSGFWSGRAAPLAGTIADFGLTDYGFATPFAVTARGQYNPVDSRLLTLDFGSIALNLFKPEAVSYDYDAPRPDLSGTLVTTAYGGIDNARVVLSFASDGTLTGLHNDTCSFTGIYTPRGTKNVYDLRIAARCFTGGSGVMRGVAFRHTYLFNGQTVNQWLMPLADGTARQGVLLWTN